MEDIKWLKDCEICNVGLCKEVDAHKAIGSSEKKIFEYMAKQTRGLYTSDAIRHRYKYYTKTRGKALSPQKQGVRNPHPLKKIRVSNSKRKKTSSPRVEKEQLPLNPISQKAVWEEVANQMERLVKFVESNCQYPPNFTDKVKSRIDFSMSAIKAFYERMTDYGD